MKVLITALSQTVDGVTTNYTYNNLDQMLTAGPVQYEYDGRGNLKKEIDGSQIAQYNYDAANRLASLITPDGTITTNSYDVDGHRVKQVVGSQVTTYLWDETSLYGDVILETTAGINTSYTLAGTQLISQTRNGSTSYFLQDGQGSTRTLTNGAGAVTDTYSYTAFGEIYDQTGATENNYLYTGQQFDPSTGLYSLRARFYNPSWGRFLSQDTWAVNYSNPIELNRYGYTANNPINGMDPSGHNLVEFLLTIVNSVKNNVATYVAYVGGATVYYYLVALNTPWIINGMLLVGGSVEGYLLYRALFLGDQDAAFALASGYMLTGYSYSALVDLATRIWGATRMSLILGKAGSQALGLATGSTEDLPKFIPTNQLRYTQKSVYSSGNIWQDGQIVGQYTIDENAAKLVNDPGFDLPPVRVFKMESYMSEWSPMQKAITYADGASTTYVGNPKNLEVGQIYTLDNRRLATYLQAGRSVIPVEWADIGTIMENIFEFSTTNSGISIEILHWAP